MSPGAPAGAGIGGGFIGAAARLAARSGRRVGGSRLSRSFVGVPFVALLAGHVPATGIQPADFQQRGVVQVAVAANFVDVQDALAERFAAATGNEVRASAGSSGQLYAQIRNGAPFDVFLAADAERPRLLEQEGFTVAGTRIAYAEGRLALYGPVFDSVRAGGADLRERRGVRLAIANPRIAPYGAAAVQVLDRLGLRDGFAGRIVTGENVGQAYQFVRSGAAEMGLIALSQVVREPRNGYWIVPREFHAPLLQEAVLLRPGAANPAAREYLRFLRGDEARRIIESYGYATLP